MGVGHVLVMRLPGTLQGWEINRWCSCSNCQTIGVRCHGHFLTTAKQDGWKPVSNHERWPVCTIPKSDTASDSHGYKSCNETSCPMDHEVNSFVVAARGKLIHHEQRFLAKLYTLLRLKNMVIIAYQPWNNEQDEGYSWRVGARLRHSVAEYQWAGTFSCIRQPPGPECIRILQQPFIFLL